MANHRNIIKSTAEYTRSYKNLRGVDLSELSCDAEKRFSYLENMFVDYDGDGGIESIPGFRKLFTLDGKINRIFSKRCDGYEYLAVHAGTKLYYFKADDKDSLTEPPCIYNNLRDGRSCSAAYGENLYIFDGEKIIKVDKNGTASEITSESADVYIPTTHIDGEKSQPRNLLTNSFYQQYTVKSTDELSFETEGLTYTILDYDKELCAVSGSYKQITGILHIPSYTSIAGRRYKVVEILDYAFHARNGITALITNTNLEKIGNKAFAQCTDLNMVYLSKTVKSIGAYSFEHCTALSFFYLGDEFEAFGITPFNKCTSLRDINYAKDSEDFEKIENTADLEDRAVYYNIPNTQVVLAIQLKGNVSEIIKVQVDGEDIDYDFLKSRQMISVYCSDRELIQGRTITISGTFSDAGDGFLSTELGKRLEPTENILGCSMACSFDGRIFLSGNPALPGVVFYSEVGISSGAPLYFSTDSYLIDGTGDYPVSSLLPVGEKLLVFKSGDDGAGSIFYHTAEGEKNDRRYPVSFIRNGNNLSADSCVFMGDGIFVSGDGVCSATGGSSDTPSISCLSNKISKLLSCEPASDIRLAEWRGYLVVASGGRMYLADSRGKYTFSGSRFYEWYYLNGIGTYRQDTRIYRYLSKSQSGRKVHPKPDTVVEATVYSVKNQSGAYEYYTIEHEGDFSVYPTEEYRGGSFYPATEIFSLGSLLFFGTGSGDLCVFNNDKRGVPPPYIADSDGFDPEEYKKKMGNIIHPYYYSFGNHSVSYTIATAADDCGISYLEKSTIRSSFALKLKCMSDCEISIFVKTDKSGIKELCKIHPGKVDFYSLDFSRLAIDGADYATISINEHEKGWIEKQFIFTAQSFRAPMGIHSLAYRYKIKGKIRNM
ncbi:MAG: leucine-rich repeat protein [Clostridia bacterium]|nr:leucine-rich repeat protein [Clostridia bacterium]